MTKKTNHETAFLLAAQCWGRLILLVALTTGCLSALDSSERFNVPFSDPSGVKRVECHMMNSGITVKTHAGKDVIVEVKSMGDGERRPAPPGMRRIGGGGVGLTVEESSNVISIRSSGSSRGDVTILVPVDTSLKLNALNHGAINVEGVSGEIDAHNLNGSITLTNISGSVVANTMNGKLLVTMNQVTPNKPMGFSTLNGSIDVTLPASVKADLKIKTDNGDVFSDFDVALKPASAPQTSTETKGGKKLYRLRSDHTTNGSINGGGPEFSFITLNGTVSIHKK